MRILLVNPRCNRDFIHEAGPIRLPNNLLILAGYGRTKGHHFRILDMNVNDEKSLLTAVREWLPDIVGVTVMTGPVIKNAIEISQFVKKTLPRASVIWGGVHPTMLPEQVLKDPFVDIVVIRDGEQTLVDIADALSVGTDLSPIAGIAYRRENTVCFSSPRQLLRDLDELPDPAWDLFDMKRYLKHSRVTLNTSRGCPFQCTFCYNKIVNRGRRAELSARRVFDQIDHLHKTYDIDSVDFLEDNFTFNMQRVEEFCHLMIESGLPIKWTFEGRCPDVDQEHLELFKKAGCTHMRFGVESGSQRILNFVKKGITVGDVRRVLRECEAVGITTTMYLMMGIPTETDKDRRDSLELLDEFPDTDGDLVTYRPYPGTDLFDYCIESSLFVPPDKTIDWLRISDQYDPRFSVDKSSWRDIWKCRLHVDIHNRKRRIVPARSSLPALLSYMLETLILRTEQLSLILHIPRYILVKPVAFLASFIRSVYHGFKNLCMHGYPLWGRTAL